MVAEECLLREYQANFTRHQEYWKRSCTRAGAVFTRCVAGSFLHEMVPEELLKNEILMARSR